MLVEIPLKVVVSSFMGYLNGKSSQMIYEKNFQNESINMETGNSGAEGITWTQQARMRKRYRNMLNID